MKTFLLFFLISFSTMAQMVSHETPHVKNVASHEHFLELSIKAEGNIRQGHTIKFLIDRRDGNDRLYFLNANYCPTNDCEKPLNEAIFHYQFSRTFLDDFNWDYSEFTANFYRTSRLEDRKLIGGRIQTLETTIEGRVRRIYGVRFIERDLINEEMVKFAMEKIKDHFFDTDGLAFVKNSSEQHVETIREWFKEQNILSLTMEQVMSGVEFVGLNPGEAYGVIRFFPSENQTFAPTDIPIFDQVPIDLSVVAATATRSFQDVGSHVNLKAMERNTPNMVVRRQTDLDKLRSLDGLPVILKVTYDGFTVSQSSMEEVQNHYRSRLSQTWTSPTYNTEPTEIEFFEKMCQNHAPAVCLSKATVFGGKAAGLGFLAHKEVAGRGSAMNEKLGYRLTPIGFGVPVSHYRTFLAKNYKKGSSLRNNLEKLLRTELELDELRPLPPGETEISLGRA